MTSDKEKWDYRHANNQTATNPLELLVQNIIFAKKGKALDIACGMGRNSLFMRDSGFIVDSVDISPFAISHLQNLPNINPICADLDTFIIPKKSYYLICNSFFLERRLFPFIIQGLKKGGILIFETFVKNDNETYNTPITNPSHFLRKNELLKAFLDLEILFYEEKPTQILNNQSSTFAVTARLVARA
ncbi:class I SAM-dependent methyltransferase [Helicobacter apodemus]|uniref:Tellurium resistance protein TehB n=1 Tax=Helicobacter apodemus TaxID=135569 RepID=A0A2U8FBP2_9HELI|nr:methyltransferase domain-containing protein [Helicobacter apodemus]AWI33317.1 tellurium resistance protein TehB [Helicobacter apodemus]